MTTPDTAAARRLTAYEHRLARTGTSTAFGRWAMGRAGTFAVNGPVFGLHENLRLESSMRVLDVGCGRGSALRILDERTGFAPTPVGVDVSSTTLRLARADDRGRPLALVRAAATSLPFPDQAFDLVISSYLLRHLADEEARRFFEELRRVLAPGGLVLVWEFAPTGNPRLDGWNARVLSTGVHQPRLRSGRALMALAELAGFSYIRNARLRPFLLPPIPRASVLAGKPPAGWSGAS